MDHSKRNEMIVSTESASEPPELDVVIEIPKGSFLKRGSAGQIDFVSPLPCPFNYGSVPGPSTTAGDSDHGQSTRCRYADGPRDVRR
jgi:hypothetical protein